MAELQTQREAPVPHRQLPTLTVIAIVTSVLAGLALLAALLLAIYAQHFGPQFVQVTLFGHTFEYQHYVPARALILAGALAIIAVLLSLAAAEVTAAVRTLAPERRLQKELPPDVARLRSRVLGPTISALDIDNSAVVMPSARPNTPAPQKLTLTVLVPAHNEAATIAATLDSLMQQSRTPQRIVVIADNCTDDTADIAREHGADVFFTVNNTLKKAGGLNQWLTQSLPTADPHDVFMVMDADTTLVPGFLEVALGRLETNPDYAAIGGVFFGEGGAGLVGALQRNEYIRYARDISRRKGKVFVLTGTASLFRAYAFQAVADARGLIIPGEAGQVYDTYALTEDNEITLALKTLGAHMVSPMQCRTITEVMPSWQDLYKQRQRWQRGALENIGIYGVTRTTIRYWGQQLGIGYGTIALNAYLLLMIITILAADGVRFMPFWLALGSIFVVEKVVTVWSGGWRARLLALPLVIEIGYDLFLQFVFAKSLFDIATGQKANWNHLQRTEETP